MDSLKMDELANSMIVDDVLEHHGIKGMKWGVRREEGPDGNVSSNPAVKTETPTSSHAGAPAGSSKATSHLSNAELQAVVTRMNLEKQMAQLTAEQNAKADTFIKSLMKDIGKRQVKRLANTAADIAIEQAIHKIGVKTENPGIAEVATRLGGKKKK